MNWFAITSGEWLRQSQKHRAVIGNHLFALQIIGVLSSLIFAFNFCLELFALLSQDRSHQLLILALQICLATWAVVEVGLLHKRQPALHLGWLGSLLGLQLLLEVGRIMLVLWGQPFGIENSFGIFRGDLGPLAILIPMYLLIFFGISKALMNLHAKELDKAWERLTRAAVIESKQQEREQLLRDMHDGLGSQIATMRIMAEQGRLDAARIPEYLQDMSADLHLIVDTFRHAEDVTLSSAIADLRYRLRQRLGSGSLQLYWKIDLNPEPKLDSHAILNVLRILQEAINNALRHANPSNIWVEASVQKPTGILKISVRNDGLAMPTAFRKGRGLNNMETRARELSGHIQLIRQENGLEVMLLIGPRTD